LKTGFFVKIMLNLKCNWFNIGIFTPLKQPIMSALVKYCITFLVSICVYIMAFF